MRRIRQGTVGRRERPLTMGVILLLSVCTLTQCVCQSARKDDEAHQKSQAGPPPRIITAIGGDAGGNAGRLEEVPEKIDVADLDQDEQTILLAVLKEHMSQAKQIRCNMPLARHTSFRIGGVADLFVEPNTLDELRAVVSVVRAEQVPLFLLGGGTNVLISDKGVRGVVVKLGGGRLGADVGHRRDAAAARPRQGG